MNGAIGPGPGTAGDDPAARIAGDAEWLAHRYDPGHDAVHFVRLARAEHAGVTFVTDDYLPQGRTPAVIARARALPPARAAAAPLHFVFHAAFCCSTLVARALDRPGWAMALKEPVILNDLVAMRRAGAAPADLRARLDDALVLLARGFAPHEPVAIKPSNAVNGLAIEMMALRPQARALLMYAPLGDFLLSIAKKGLDGRIFARTLLLHLLRDGLVRARLDQDQLFALTDLQAAAMAWLAQVDLFRAMARRFGDRVRTLAAPALLADPAAAMAGVARLFGLANDPATIAAVAAGPAFATHSKSGERFAARDRTADYAGAAALHGDEIAKVVAWTEAVAAAAALPLDPGAPLLP